MIGRNLQYFGTSLGAWHPPRGYNKQVRICSRGFARRQSVCFRAMTKVTRRSSRKRKPTKRFELKQKLRRRGTGKRILKKEGKKTSNVDIRSKRDIRSAVKQRAAPLIAKINEQHSEVCFIIYIFGLLNRKFL